MLHHGIKIGLTFNAVLSVLSLYVHGCSIVAPPTTTVSTSSELLPSVRNHGSPSHRSGCLSKQKYDKANTQRKTKNEKDFESPLTMWPEPSSLNSTSFHETCKHFIKDMDPEDGIMYNDRCGFLNYIELVLHERLDMCPNVNQTQQLDDKTTTTTFLSNFKAYRKLLVDKIPQCSLEDPRNGLAFTKPGHWWRYGRLSTEIRESTGEARDESLSLLASTVERPLVEKGSTKVTVDVELDKLKCSAAQHADKNTFMQEQGESHVLAKDSEQKIQQESRTHETSRHSSHKKQQTKKKLPEPPRHLQKSQPQKKIAQHSRVTQQLQDLRRRREQQKRLAISVSLSRCSLLTLRARLLQCIPPRVPPPQVGDTSSTEKEGYFCQFNYVVANIVNSQTAAQSRVRKTFATAPIGSRETSRNSSIVSSSFRKGEGAAKKKDKAARRPKLKLPQIVLSRADGVHQTKFPEIKVNMKRSQK